jgi:hypothetical protein
MQHNQYIIGLLESKNISFTIYIVPGYYFSAAVISGRNGISQRDFKADEMDRIDNLESVRPFIKV